MKIRVGFGYDVHRLTEGRDLWLGGIRLDHTKGLLGHSDADVLIHAICDALLGAANMRDIGYHFPDTAGEFEHIDSKILLKKTVQLIAAKGYAEILGNLTITTGYGSDITNVPVFAGLQKIHGNLNCYNNSSFPDLAYVGGNLTGRDEYWTAEYTDKLTYVGGDMEIRGTDIIGFNNLEEVNALSIFGSANGFKNMIRVKGELRLGGGGIVQGFDNLTEVGEKLDAYNITVFPEFPNLKSCGEITISTVGKEGGIYNGFNALETVMGNIELRLEFSEFYGFESLKLLNGYLRIYEGDYLSSIPEFPALERVENNHNNISGIHIECGPLLAKVSGFNNLVTCNGIRIEGEALQEVDGFNSLVQMHYTNRLAGLNLSGNILTKVTGFSSYAEGGISIDAPLTVISDFASFATGNVALSNTCLTDISGFNALTGGNIYLGNNSKLEHISGFNAVTGQYKNPYYTDLRKIDVDLISNVLLKDITGFAALDTLGSFSIVNCYSLETLPLVNRLTYLEGLSVENNYSLTTIPVFQPTVLLNGLIVTGNTALEDFTNFQSVLNENTYVTISNNKYNPTKEDILAGKGKPEE